VTRWDRFFVIVQRISSVLVILVAILFVGMLAQQWLAFREFDQVFEQEFEPERQEFGGKFERKLPYSGQEIETAEGSLIAIFQEGETSSERVELGGITLTNPTTGTAIEVAPDAAASVVQFELIFDQGDEGKVVGYLATIATPEQYEQGRMDLVVGALPAMTRNVAVRNIRYSDLPRIRGDGSVGLLMWPEEGEAWLVAIRLEDGAVIERTSVKLPVLRSNDLSQGPGDGHFALGKQNVPVEAPRNVFH
jgi:hypothetical protein